MIYSDGPDRHPVKVLRVATLEDVRGLGLDAGSHAAARRPGRLVLLCEDLAVGGNRLCETSGMLADDPLEISVAADRALGGAPPV